MVLSSWSLKVMVPHCYTGSIRTVDTHWKGQLPVVVVKDLFGEGEGSRVRRKSVMSRVGLVQTDNHVVTT